MNANSLPEDVFNWAMKNMYSSVKKNNRNYDGKEEMNPDNKKIGKRNRN